MPRKAALTFALVALGAFWPCAAALTVQWPPGPGFSYPDTLQIRNLQDPNATHFASPGDTVLGIGGIVTAFDGLPTGFSFYLQNSNPGPAVQPYTGINVFTGNFDFSTALFGLAVGDSLVVYGRLREFPSLNGGTEIEGPDGSSSTEDVRFRRVAAGSPLPAFHDGTVNELREDVPNANGEPWEGMLVRITSLMRVSVSPTPEHANSFLLVDATAPPPPGAPAVFVDGYTLTTYPPPAVGTLVCGVQGVYDQRARGYRIQLRNANDLNLNLGPSPVASSIPSHIDVVGTHGGIPDARGRFTVNVRGVCNNPVPGAAVTVDFSGCTDVRIARLQEAGTTVREGSNAVTRVTDSNGDVQFDIVGAGTMGCDRNTCPPGSTSSCARICANGVLLGHARVSVYDLDGASPTGVQGVNLLDQELWLTDFACGLAPARSDYNHDGLVSPADLSVFLGSVYAEALRGLGSASGAMSAGYVSGPFTPYCP